MIKRIQIAVALCGALFSFTHSVLAQEENLLSAEPVWALSPGDREYLTTVVDGVSAGYAEKGLAYNPVTGNLYLVHYSSSTGIMGIHILDAETGEDLGKLSTAGIQGGTQPIRKIAVSEDGIIYAGNVTTNTASNPYKLYRWTSETADPEVIWQGDPSNGEAGVLRNYGGNLDLRDNGDSTQIVIAPDYWEQNTEPHVVAVLNISGDDTPIVTPQFIVTQPTTRFGLGIAFGEGDTFWGTRAGQPLREFDFNGNLLREFSSAVVAGGLSPFDINLEKGILAGITGGSGGSRQLYIYDLNTLDHENFNTPLAIRNYPTSHPNIEANGAIAFSENLIFALDTNNGIVAYYYGPPLPVPPGDLYWTNSAEIRTAEIDGSNPRTVVAGLVRPIGIDIDPVAGVMYWAEDANSVLGAGKIMRANIDGTNIGEVLTGRSTPQFLRFNPKDGRIYWAEYSTGLYSVATDGTDVRHLLDIAGGSTAGVALDLENDIVYLGSAGGQLYQYHIGDPFPATPEPLTDMVSQTYGIAFDSAANRVWATSFTESKVYYKDLATLAPTVDTITGLSAPLGISFTEDNSQIVWVERTGGKVQIANYGETSVTTLVSDETSPFGIVVRPSAPAQSDFASWIATFDLAENEREPDADPDGDGISNLLEFALDLDPSIANRHALPQPQIVHIDNNDYLVLEVAKNTAAGSVSLIVEASSDLGDWNSGDGHTVILEDSISTLRVRDAQPIGESARRFLRLRAVGE